MTGQPAVSSVTDGLATIQPQRLLIGSLPEYRRLLHALEK